MTQSNEQNRGTRRKTAAPARNRVVVGVGILGLSIALAAALPCAAGGRGNRFESFASRPSAFAVDAGSSQQAPEKRARLVLDRSRTQVGSRFLPPSGRPRLCGEPEWRTATPLPTSRSFPGVAELDGKIYVVGGGIVGGHGTSTTLESYNPATREWTVETPLPPQARMSSPVVESVGGKLYVLGGYPTNEESWEYDPETSQWTFKGYAGFGSTITGLETVSGVIDDKIYIVDHDWGGGQVRAYDPERHYTVQVSPRRPIRRAETTGGIIDGRIYVAGGILRSGPGGPGLPPVTSEIVGLVEAYDVAGDTWTTVAPLNEPRMHASSAVMGGKLYVVGGYDKDPHTGEHRFVETMEIYDPVTDAWTAERGLPTPRYGHVVAGVGGRLYAIGGLDSLLGNPTSPPLALVESFGRDCVRGHIRFNR